LCKLQRVLDSDGPAEVTRPLVGIGLPTYNRAAYLNAALGYLVAQDYPTLELIVCDNASTDETRAVAEDWARRDSRIRYHRQPTTVSIYQNFQAALDMASTDYFMWAADDDAWEPAFVSSVMRAYAEGPGDLILVMSHYDIHNHVINSYAPVPMPDIDWRNSLFRNSKNFLERPAPSMFYGIFRRSFLRTSRALSIGHSMDWDAAYLISEALSRGRVHLVPKILFHAGIVETIRPFRTFEGEKFLGLNFAYEEYYLRMLTMIVDATTFSASEKAELVRCLNAQVLRFITGQETLSQPVRQFLTRLVEVTGQQLTPELFEPRINFELAAEAASGVVGRPGMFADGWLGSDLGLRLWQAEPDMQLVVRGMIPAVDQPPVRSELDVRVDDRELISATLGPGDFELRAAVPGSHGRRHIVLAFSRFQQLPPPDRRRVTAQISYVGFESTRGARPVGDRARST
jgi:glycosyltransferase involved in cell wall biosynthesis